MALYCIECFHEIVRINHPYLGFYFAIENKIGMSLINFNVTECSVDEYCCRWKKDTTY